jgi:ubiquinone/menaquinone biosynthesis C-methylase UbiE
VDQNKLSFLAHHTHRFASPVSEVVLDRTLGMAGMPVGATCFDLGCGTGGMALHLAEAYGLAVKAVDRSPLMIAEARARLVGRGSPGSVSLHEEGSIGFLAREGAADLVVAIGAVALTASAQDAASILKALAAHVRPGGCLLWGETHWKREPSDMIRLLLGPTASVYGSHADYIHAGVAADLLPLYAVTASDQDWDEYTWRYTTALENHLREHPDDPDAAEIRNRAQGWRALYLAEARDTMGFGLYLFRKEG